MAEYAGALRAAAAMYRAALEEICRERGAGNGSLEKKIDALKSKGVPDDVVDQFHEARFLGNWSLHDAVEFAPDEVADVAELIRDAVFEIYVQPAQRQALRGARQARRDAHRAAQNKTPNQDL
ncbi:uncharacterized protein DUF4145 [Allonocardiopsis opalescens]|uniref:Uncharacterized protein DUF4145 n=1 Tax=Allonocardiopsis opalescens TaxID=1144618 RepID=A0A2T0PXH1_9ACTN|nr:uncharacterized protein DUF4145 [Allonocardiopsis opalescens]